MSNVGYLIQTITCAHEHILYFKVPNRTPIGCSWAGFRKLRSFREPPITSINVNYGIQSLWYLWFRVFLGFGNTSECHLCSDVFQIDCKIIKNFPIMQPTVYTFRLFYHYLHKKRQFVPFSRFVRSRFIRDIKKAWRSLVLHAPLGLRNACNQ